MVSTPRRTLLRTGLAGAAVATSGSWLAACSRGGDDDASAVDIQPEPFTAAPPSVSDSPPSPRLQPSRASSLLVANATLTLDRMARASLPLDERFAGLSYEKNKLTQPLFTPANTAFVGLLRRLGPGVVRIGGNQVDLSSWNGIVPGIAVIRPAQVDALAGFLAATGWKVIYGINMAQNTLANAQAEAAYAAAMLGDSLLCFEIGNEPDLYRSNGLRPSTWTYADFLKEWREMRAAISAVVPNAVFSGPVTAFNIRDYVVPFARDQGGTAAMLSHHYYRANGHDPASTLDLLLSPDPTLAAKLASMTKATADASMPLGWRMAECNSFYNGGAPGVSNLFGTALWAIDFMFTCALAGCSGVNFHTGNSVSYTTLVDRAGVIEEVRPGFHAMMLFSQAAQGRAIPAIVTTSTAQRLDVSAWGVLRHDGGVNVMLVNRSPDAEAVVAMNLGQAGGPLRPTLLDCATGLTGTRDVRIGGSAVGVDGAWTPTSQDPIDVDGAGGAVVAVPPASALLLRST